MESLCALNPLDHFFIDQDISIALFNSKSPDGSTIQTKEQVAHYLSEQQYHRLKPALKQQISNEISKLVSKGLHSKTSIREFIQN